MFWNQNTKWQRAKEKLIPSQIQNAKRLKINGTLKMKTGIREQVHFGTDSLLFGTTKPSSPKRSKSSMK